MLRSQHIDHLLSEGFSPEHLKQMESWGVRSIEPQEATEMGFRVKDQPPTGGIYFPFIQGFGQIRCDNPPIRNGKPAKYLTPVGSAAKAWNSEAAVITEGFKDAAAGTMIGGIQTGALAGVSHHGKALKEGSGQTILFDHDAWSNPSIFLNLFKAGKRLKGKIQVIPAIEGEPKAGLCEYFKAGHTAADYRNLIAEAIRPEAFLMALPEHWHDLDGKQLALAIPVLFNLAARHLKPLQQEAIVELVKRVASVGKKLGARAVARDWQRAIDRVQKERARELAKSGIGKIPIDFDKKGEPVLPKASFVANFLTEKYRGRLAWDQVSESFWRYESKHKGVWTKESDTAVRGVVVAELNSSAARNIYSSEYVGSIANLMRDQLLVTDWTEAKGLLPMVNGVLDRETMTLKPHAPGYRFRWRLPYDYDPAATCQPIVEWMLEAQDGDRQRVDVLLAYLKAVLDGRTDLQRFLECVGHGGSGKGTYTRLAMALVGAENCHTTTLQQLEKNRFESASIYGKRLVVIADADRWAGDVSTLKSLTGQDSLRYEAKNIQQGNGFIPQAMVIISENEEMQSTDNTSGLARRRLVMPFNKVVDSSDRRDLITIGPQSASGEFAPYLPGLLNLVLSIPDSEVTRLVRDTDKNVASLAKARIKALLETNPIAGWADSNLVLDPGARTNVGRLIKVRYTEGDPGNTKSYEVHEHSDKWLYPNYVQFCMQSGQSPVSMKRFSNLLSDLMVAQLKLPVKNPPRDRDGAHFIGIAIRNSDDDRLRPISGQTAKPTGNPSEMIATDAPGPTPMPTVQTQPKSRIVPVDAAWQGENSSPRDRNLTISHFADRIRKLDGSDSVAAEGLVQEMQPLPLEWRRSIWSLIKNCPGGTAIRRAIEANPELKRADLMSEKVRKFQPVLPSPIDSLPTLFSTNLEEYMVDPEAESA